MNGGSPPDTAPSDERRARVALALAALAACASLAYGASFDLDAFDSAELALVAVTRGLGHPPGQPAHTMLGWLVTRGPWRPLSALAWLSIAPMAMALWLAARALRARFSPAGGALTVACALAVAGFGPVRESVTRVEVYALATLFTVAAIALARPEPGREESPRRALATGVLWGLAGATNPVVAAQGAWGVLAPLVAQRRWRSLAIATASALVSVFASYGYAFAAKARETQTLAWSAPGTATELKDLILARDFAQNVSLGVAGWLSNAVAFSWDLARSGAGLFVLAGLVGLGLRRDGRRDPWLGALAFSTLVGVAMVAANARYRAENPDYGGYVLVSLALATAGVLRALATSPRAAQATAACGLAALGLWGSFAHGRPAGSVRALAQRALDAAPPRAIEVLESDHLLFAALYLQTVEGVRRDVTVLNPGWASSSWAWRWALARDASLRVDLRPGVGRERRLALALRARDPSRAVVAERLTWLSQADAERAGPRPFCPRGLLWSTREGCDERSRSTADAVAFLRAAGAQARASRARWDERVLLYSAAALGDGARAVGCAGVAARVYAGALDAPAPSIPRGCGTAPDSSGDALDLLDLRADALRARLARATALAARAP